MADKVAESQPTPPSWLNRDFIQIILRAEDPTLVVTSCEVAMANAVGAGYASDMYRVTAKLQNNKERRVIVKCHPQGGMMEEAVRNVKAFETEARMLSETLPKIDKLLDEVRPGKFKPISPKCLHYGKEPIEFLVLEDLCETGFTVAKRQQGLNFAHCSMIIKTLARLHASSLALFDRDPEAVEVYEPGVYHRNRQYLAPVAENAFRLLVKEISKWPGYEKYVPKLTSLIQTMFSRVAQLTEKKSSKFNVLLHGDCWSNNVMFKYAGDSVQDIRLVDFQISNFSSPALDLHYFLHSCPNIDVRMNSLSTLLQEYHRTFTEILEILGCTKYIISFQQLREIFKEYYFFGLFTATSVLPVALSKPGDSFDVEESPGETADGDGNNAKIYSNEVYANALKRLLPVFDQEGLLD